MSKDKMNDRKASQEEKGITTDYIFELNPDATTSENIQEINDLLKNNGIVLEVTQVDDKSFLRMSIALKKLHRNAGRKKSDDRIRRLQAYAEKIRAHKSQEEIMDEMKISQATYYRYAKELEAKE